MNTKIIGGIVLIVIIVAIAWLLLGQGGSPGQADTTQPQNTQETSATATQNSGSGTIASLMAMGSVQCDVTTTEGGTTSQGTIYVASGKMRGNFTGTSQDQTVNAMMINDGTTIYTWTDKVAQGFKMPVSAATGANASARGGVNPSTNVQYNCRPWIADTALFAPPSNVSFMMAPGM